MLTATHCNTLQHMLIHHSNSLENTLVVFSLFTVRYLILQVDCNTLQHTATCVKCDVQSYFFVGTEHLHTIIYTQSIHTIYIYRHASVNLPIFIAHNTDADLKLLLYFEDILIKIRDYFQPCFLWAPSIYT